MQFRFPPSPDDSIDRCYPVKVFFNLISDVDFLRVIRDLSNEIGRGEQTATCLFPGNLDPWEPTFTGVQFCFMDEEVVVDYRTFFEHLKAACEYHVARYPQERSAVDAVLKTVAERYCLD